MQSHAVKDYNTYAKLGQFQEAAKCLQTALKDKPNDLETFYMLHRLGEKILDPTLKNLMTITIISRQFSLLDFQDVDLL